MHGAQTLNREPGHRLEANYPQIVLVVVVVLGFSGMTSSMKSYGTLRTRTGLVIDNLLLYATGGFAYGGVSLSANLVATPLAVGDD